MLALLGQRAGHSRPASLGSVSPVGLAIGPGWRWAFAGCCWLTLMGHDNGPQKDNDWPVPRAECGPENGLGP